MNGFGMNYLRISGFGMGDFEISGLRMKSLRMSGLRISGLEMCGLEKSGLEGTDLIGHYDGRPQCPIDNSKDLPACFCVKSSIVIIMLYILFIVEIVLQFFFSKH